MPAIAFIAGILVAVLYSPSKEQVVRAALSYCGPDHPAEWRPRYCPKSCE